MPMPRANKNNSNMISNIHISSISQTNHRHCPMQVFVFFYERILLNFSIIVLVGIIVLFLLVIYFGFLSDEIF